MLGEYVHSQKKENKRRLLARTTLGVFFLLFVVAPLSSLAQSIESTNVAKTISVADPEISYGDIVLFDHESNLYRISRGKNDPRFYGVVVQDPALVIEMDNGHIPIVEGGVVPINVTLENGEIAVGDPITTATVPGKGMRGTEYANVFGFALEPLTEDEALRSENSEHGLGTILVEVGGERLRAYATLQAEAGGSGDAESEETVSKTDAGAVMRFGFASSVALGAIFLIFFAFLSSIKQGVISVGRNPRAEASIRSMIVLNVVMAIVITAAAMFFAISLLVIEG